MVSHLNSYADTWWGGVIEKKFRVSTKMEDMNVSSEMKDINVNSER